MASQMFSSQPKFSFILHTFSQQKRWESGLQGSLFPFIFSAAKHGINDDLKNPSSNLRISKDVGQFLHEKTKSN